MFLPIFLALDAVARISKEFMMFFNLVDKVLVFFSKFIEERAKILV